MRFTLVDPIPARDGHLLKQFESESGMVKVCIEAIVGAVRVSVWYERPDAQYPDILQCIWDTPPDGRMLEILEGIFTTFDEFPEMADQRAVQTRLQIHMYEKYGDIYDGCRARPIDRDTDGYNPHANPWWNDAQHLREQLQVGVYRHTCKLNLEAVPLGDVWAAPIDNPEEPPPRIDDGEPKPTGNKVCLGCDAVFSVTTGGATPGYDTCPLCGSSNLEDEIGPASENTEWLEQAWKNERETIEPERPNPAWRGPPKPFSG